MAVALVGAGMVLLDVSIVNVALPSIRSGLNASSDQLQWVLSGYALAFGLFLVPAGRLGDMHGRRTVFVVALGLFTLASLACGLAPSATFLVIARLIQGFAGGSLTPQITGLIQELFSGDERGRAFGVFGTVLGVCTAIGPLLGGVLIQVFGPQHGWRLVFGVNVPVGIVAMILSWRLIPHGERDDRRRHSFDVVGVLLLGASVVALLLPLVQAQQWPGAGKWWLLAVAAALAVAFVAWEHRATEPLLDLQLFRSPSYSFGIGMISLYFAGFTPLFFVFSLFLQNGQGYSALLTGLATVPFAVGSASTAILGGRLVARLGRRLVLLGLVLVLLGLAGTWLAVRLFPDHGTGLATVIPLLLAGLGGGLVITPNQTITLSQVPVAEAGSAGGLLQTGQRVGAALGIAAVGAVFFAAMTGKAGGWNTAFSHGILVALGFVVLALVVAVIDVVIDARAARRQ